MIVASWVCDLARLNKTSYPQRLISIRATFPHGQKKWRVQVNAAALLMNFQTHNLSTQLKEQAFDSYDILPQLEED